MSRKLVEPETIPDKYLLSQASIEKEKQRMRKKLGLPLEKTPEKKHPLFYDKYKVTLYKAGIEKEPLEIMKLFLHISLIITGLGLLFIIPAMLFASFPWYITLLYTILWIIFGFLFFYSLTVVSSKVFVDYRIFKRKTNMEKVLPEFFRLVATNYRSGLSLEQALIKSNRPRFGVLSKEIAVISKTAKVKGDLALALEVFGKKYDSKVLQRAVNNIAMSIRSGSNISDLLEAIANNITKMRNMRAGMAANVKNYIIFIIVAAIIIAPLMFSMSYQMNSTISFVKSNIQTAQGLTQTLSFQGGILPANLDIFVFLMLITNSIVCATVISMIRYGHYQQGLKNIPLFIAITFILYILGKNLLSAFIVFL